MEINFDLSDIELRWCPFGWDWTKQEHAKPIPEWYPDACGRSWSASPNLEQIIEALIEQVAILTERQIDE